MRNVCRTLTISLCTALLAAGTLTFADADARSVSYDLNIPSEDLTAALQSFAIASHHKLLYKAELTAGKISRALKGHFTAQEAMEALLSGTGLSYEITGSSVVLIKNQPNGRTSGLREEGTAPSSPRAAPQSGDGPPILLAQVNQGTSGPPAVSDDQNAEKRKKDEGLSEIVVTGSRIAVAPNQGAQDTKVYTKEQIEQSGQTNVADFLNTLPGVSQGITDMPIGPSGGGTTVSLRGLPPGTTLVLINGRRIESSGIEAGYGDFFDLNNIPVSAIERIEVIANGSSAVYGSDAIAGVVNIILRKDFDGVEIGAKQSWANSIEYTDLDAAFGKKWDKGSFSIVASYQARGELNVNDRTRTASNDYTAFGGPDGNQPICNTANVFSQTGAVLPGAANGATYAGLTRPQSGRPTLTDFNYGTLNQCGIALGYSIFPASHRAGVFAQGSLELTPAVELYTELMYSRITQDSQEGYGSLYGSPGFQSYSLGAANPYNPFGTTVGIGGNLVGVPKALHLDTDFYRLLIGAKGSWTANWKWEVSAWDSADSTENYESNVSPNAGAIQAALNSSDSVTALNPFTSGLPATPSVLRQLFQDDEVKDWGREQSFNGYLTGTAFELPAGPLQLVAGAEYDRDYLASDLVFAPGYISNTRTAYSRNEYAAFGESRIPIWRGSSKEPMLTATLALRYDHFSDFGGTTNPQYGLEFRPTDTLLVRATYAKSFKAPPLTDLYQAPYTNTAPVVDPKTGQTSSATVVSGGNSGLAPTNGRSYTYGVLWISAVIPDLRISLTNWNVDERNLIEIIDPQTIVDNENIFPSRVTRDANGMIVGVNDTALNFGSIAVAGLDYSVGYSKQTDYGRWSPSLTLTQTYHYEAQITPGSPSVSGLSIAQDSYNWSPRIKGTIALGWKEGPVGASIDGRYLGKYRDYDTTRETGNYWVSDANVRYQAGAMFSSQDGVVHGSYIELGAINLFNRSPQYSSYFYNFLGYDATQEDIRGRVLYLRVGSKW